MTIKRSLQFLYLMHLQRKTLLFVSTRPQCAPFIQSVAQRIDQPYSLGKWIGGRLTNQKKHPDCIVLFDPHVEILHEAALLNIPVVSFFHDARTGNICASDPSKQLHYPVPGPYASLSFMYWFLNLIVKIFPAR